MPDVEGVGQVVGTVGDQEGGARSEIGDGVLQLGDRIDLDDASPGRREGLAGGGYGQ
jgi:hypothetical protein